MFNCIARSLVRSTRLHRTGLRWHSSILRTPPRSAPREAPTPLVFVTARAWDENSWDEMTVLSSMLSEKGFTCLQTDISLPDGQLMARSSDLMQYFENELKDAIRTSEFLFPPVLFARSSACLIAQTYISSHPASGLFLISPPISNSTVSKAQLPSELKEFTFEPKFPIALTATPPMIEVLRLKNRLGQDPNVDLITLPNLTQPYLGIEIERWLDELGV